MKNKNALISLAAVFVIIVSALLISHFSHRNLDEYASHLESNDYFVSGDGRIWKVCGTKNDPQTSEELLSSYADAVIVEATGDIVKFPLKFPARKKFSSEMTDLEQALTQYPPDEVFVRKSGSTWIAGATYHLPTLYCSISRYTPPAE